MQRRAVAMDGRTHHGGRHAGVIGANGRAQAQEAHRDGRRPAAAAVPPGQPVGGERVRRCRGANRADEPVRAAVRPPVCRVLAGVARVPGAGGRRFSRVRLRWPPRQRTQPAAGQFVIRPVVVHVRNIHGVQPRWRRHTPQR